MVLVVSPQFQGIKEVHADRFAGASCMRTGGFGWREVRLKLNGNQNF
jgi:hypothetical protein